jgi:hypothetical protein
MRRRLTVRAATLALALLIPLTGIRAATPSCCVDDCDRPCCEADASNSTARLVLPCCRTIAVDQASTHPAPTTVEGDHAPSPAPPPFVVMPRVAIVVGASVAARATRFLPAPPLYHQHCALLL